MKHVFTRACIAAVVGASLLASAAMAQSPRPIAPDKARVIEFWTKERRAAAIPRDLVIDERGLGYLRHRSGFLQPHGHDTPAVTRGSDPTPSPFAKGSGGSGDTTAPLVSAESPANGETIGSSATFSATVTDEGGSGVSRVDFIIQKGGGLSQTFRPSQSGDTWSIKLSGFSNGDWTWYVRAKDGARNTSAETPIGFQVDTGSGDSSGGGGSSDGVVVNAGWTAGDTGGTVQTAAGRLFYEMPNSYNKRRGYSYGWYVCSGTVVTEGATGRSVILTAAHCVYEDVYKQFATNVMFIPDQDGTSASGSDRDCSNDPIGCWVPSAGVVDENWTTRTFPDNIPWDYAFYVVSDSGAHQGATATSDELAGAAGSMSIQFAEPVTTGTDAFTHALGYSYSDDPNFMYCAQDLSTQGQWNWWLGSCGLSGGASGGPWVQPMNTTTGNGPIISVNSWGYTTSPGMAGPKLSGTSAQCLFTAAKSAVSDTVLAVSDPPNCASQTSQ